VRGGFPARRKRSSAPIRNNKALKSEYKAHNSIYKALAFGSKEVPASKERNEEQNKQKK